MASPPLPLFLLHATALLPRGPSGGELKSVPKLLRGTLSNFRPWKVQPGTAETRAPGFGVAPLSAGAGREGQPRRPCRVEAASPCCVQSLSPPGLDSTGAEGTPVSGGRDWRVPSNPAGEERAGSGILQSPGTCGSASPGSGAGALSGWVCLMSIWEGGGNFQ